LGNVVSRDEKQDLRGRTASIGLISISLTGDFSARGASDAKVTLVVVLPVLVPFARGRCA
jgi:hypothetical protein